MKQKYEITNQIFVTDSNKRLHRIRALKDFGDVKAGDYGGYIECELNLSQHGNAWVYDTAKIWGEARIIRDAQVRGFASIFDRAVISDNAIVNAALSHVVIHDKAMILGDSRIIGDSILGGYLTICGRADISLDATINRTTDYLTVGPIGSREDYTTFYKNSSGGISVTCGCFRGTLEKFKEAVLDKHGNSCTSHAYRNAIKLATSQIILVGKENEEKCQMN